MPELSKSLDLLLTAIEGRYPQWHIPRPLSGTSHTELEAARVALDVGEIELFEFLKLYDFDCCQLFPFIEQFRAVEMAAKRSSIFAMYDDANSTFEEAFTGWTSSTLESCKLDQSWRKSWIPIGQANANFVFVDLEPSNSGVVGQIVETSEDGRYLTVIASSFTHLLDRIRAVIENDEASDADYKWLSVGAISSHAE